MLLDSKASEGGIPRPLQIGDLGHINWNFPKNFLILQIKDQLEVNLSSFTPEQGIVKQVPLLLSKPGEIKKKVKQGL